MDTRKIIQAAKQIGISNFDDFAHKTNTDEGKYMIVFVTRTVNTKKVNDWGREEDIDEYIGLDNNGWIIYTHEIEHLAGPMKIKNPNTKQINDEELIEILNNKLNLKEYLDFIETCIDIRKKYRYDFDVLL